MIHDDSDQEPDETIILTLEAGNNLIIDDEPGAQLTLTIEDNDATFPRAPTGVSAIAGNTTITVSWIAVPDADNGGDTITTYTATATGGGEPFDCTATGAIATSCTITGLTNGTEYSVTVVAINAIGPSLPSTPVMATPVAAALPFRIKVFLEGAQ